MDFFDDNLTEYEYVPPKLSWEYVDQNTEQQWQANSSLLLPNFAEQYEGQVLLSKDGRLPQSTRTLDEKQLIKDLAFLLCGWESSSIFQSGGKFKLNENLAFHISRTTVVRVVSEVSVIAEKVVELEQKCSESSANLKSEDYIHTAFCQGVLQCLKLHRDFVLALSNRFSSLPSFMKTVRKSCIGITFLSDLCFTKSNGLYDKMGVNLLQSLCAVSDSIHENFLKKMTNFLIKKTLTAYLRFVDLALRGYCSQDAVLFEMDNKPAQSDLHNQDVLFLREFHTNVCNVVKQLPYLSFKDTAYLTIEESPKPQRKQMPSSTKTSPEKKIKVKTDHAIPPARLPEKLDEKWRLVQDLDDEKAKAELQKDLTKFYETMSSMQNVKFQLISWKLKRAALNVKRRSLHAGMKSASKYMDDFARVLPDILELSAENLELEETEVDDSKLKVPEIVLDQSTLTPTEDSAQTEENPDASAQDIPVSDDSEITFKDKVIEQPEKKQEPEGSSVDQLEVALPQPVKHQLKDKEAESGASSLEIKPTIVEQQNDSITSDSDKHGTNFTENSSDLRAMIAPFVERVGVLSKSVMVHFFQELRFMDHLNAIKRLAFLEDRQIVETLCAMMSPDNRSLWNLDKIQNLTNETHQPMGACLKLNSTNQIVVSYNVSPPIDQVITSEAVQGMEKISGFLIMLEAAKAHMTAYYLDCIKNKEFDPDERERTFIVYDILTFTRSVLLYCYSQIHEICWPRFYRRVSRKDRIEDVTETFEFMISSILQRIFLSKESAQIYKVICQVLKCGKNVMAFKSDVDKIRIAAAELQDSKDFLLSVLRKVALVRSAWTPFLDNMVTICQ